MWRATIPAMEKTTLYLPADLQRALRHAAHASGRSQADVVREALAQYLSEHTRPRPRSIGAIEGSADPPAREAKAWVRREWDQAEERRRADA